MPLRLGDTFTYEAKPKMILRDESGCGELAGCQHQPPAPGGMTMARLVSVPGETGSDTETGSGSEGEDTCYGAEGTNQRAMEGVIEEDERQRITPTLSQPYVWICYLRSTFQSGAKFRGTGFFCQPDQTTSGLILTCAHNLHRPGCGPAVSIEVAPAKDDYENPYSKFVVGPESYRYSEDFDVENPKADNDYGVIMVPKHMRPAKPFGFGFALLEEERLENRIIQVCGYPGDKKKGTLYLSGGKITRVDDVTFCYMNDTAGGQSGSPVWTWSKWNWMVIGIHGWYDEETGANKACKLRTDVLDDIRSWAAELSQV